VFGAAIEKADPLTNRRVAFHFLAAVRALVQLLPPAFRQLLVYHALLRFDNADLGSRITNSGQKHALIVIHA
jgi:hypothetical protein